MELYLVLCCAARSVLQSRFRAAGLTWLEEVWRELLCCTQLPPSQRTTQLLLTSLSRATALWWSQQAVTMHAAVAVDPGQEPAGAVAAGVPGLLVHRGGPRRCSPAQAQPGGALPERPVPCAHGGHLAGRPPLTPNPTSQVLNSDPCS